MKRRLSVLASSVAALVLCLGCNLESCGARRVASLEAIASLVQQRAAANPTPVAVPPKTSVKFYEGDGVTVSSSGKADLTFGGCIVEIYWGSTLDWKMSSASAPECAIALANGTIVVNATAASAVETPWAIVSSFGTRYLVRVNLELQVLWVVVWEGRLTLDPLAEGLPSVEIPEGMQTWMVRNLPPVQPVPATRSEVPDFNVFPPLELLTAYAVDGVPQRDWTDAIGLPVVEHIPGTVVVWHSWSEAAEVAGLGDVIAAFQTRYPDLKLVTQYVPVGDLRAKFETAAAAGEGPTVLLGPAEWGPALYEAKLVAELSGRVARDLLASLRPVALSAAQYRGALVGLPHALKGVVMYRNQSIIRTAPASVDELFATNKEATRGDRLGADLELSFFFSAAHLNGIGGRLMDLDGNPAFLDDKGLEWINLLKLVSGPVPTEYNTDTDLKLFMDGRAGIIVDGTWNLALLRESIGAENLAIDPWPDYTDGHLSGYVQADNLYLSATATGDDQKAAWMFMEFFLSSKAQARLAEAGHIPAVADIKVSDRLMQQALYAFERGTPFPILPEMDAYWGPMDGALKSVLLEGADAYKSLAVAYDRILAAIQKMRTPP